MKHCFLASIILATFFSLTAMSAPQLQGKIAIKAPGNPAELFVLSDTGDGQLKANPDIPITIHQVIKEEGDEQIIQITLTATDKVYYNLQMEYHTGMEHQACQFYMPGFWYRKNLRSPQEAPSFHTSDSWSVREDRLSSPLTGIFNEKNGNYYRIIRMDDFKEECLSTHTHGEVILNGKTAIGFTGFENQNNQSVLVFGYPYKEAPKTYIRKLTLIPPVTAFDKLEKGETKELKWILSKGSAKNFSGFVADTWHYTYNRMAPQALTETMSGTEAKSILSNFFRESFVDKYELAYYSGVHLRTDDCESTGSAEIGFVGRVLLNAYNALEYGRSTNDTELIEQANTVLNIYLEKGFTPAGYFREFVDFTHNEETNIYSIRRQSEGVFAILNYLEYERKLGNKHPEWEKRIKTILNNFLKLQNKDGSFPRKFDDNSHITDASGGSTPSATLPLTMAYKYFNDRRYLESAKRTAVYLEKELISKSDYFSSTLDANCEDKEASLYAATAMYYLSMVTKGGERRKYIDLCKQAAYFALSWYYMWDVPFAQGQMLGDVGFKSRGWGNVSVENNHIDVFIFEFATVLDWLAKERKEKDFASFANVIRSSMLQLMPVKGNMYDIGKVGYYPEVVQHTHWDYGKNGKGFYNDIFAPGWTVASLWQMLSADRVESFFKKGK